jgi:hypothetical protein
MSTTMLALNQPVPNNANIGADLNISIYNIDPRAVGCALQLTAGGVVTNPSPGFGLGYTPLDIDLSQLSMTVNQYVFVTITMYDNNAIFMQPNSALPNFGLALSAGDHTIQGIMYYSNAVYVNPTTVQFYCQRTGADTQLRTYNLGIVALDSRGFQVPIYLDPKIKNMG